MLVVEILEMQTDVEDDCAASFFFNDLAERNDAMQNKNDIRFFTSKDHATSPALLNDGSNKVRACAGYGYQKVAMGRDFNAGGESRRARQEIKCIRVDLHVFRLPLQETDLLITISSPADVTNLDEVTSEMSPATSEILSQVVSTFQIRDWGLFG